MTAKRTKALKGKNKIVETEKAKDPVPALTFDEEVYLVIDRLKRLLEEHEQEKANSNK